MIIFIKTSSQSVGCLWYIKRSGLVALQTRGVQ